MPYIAKKTVVQVVESGNHYMIQVKKNQPKLYQTIQECNQTQKPLDTHTCCETKRAKTTTWITKVYEVLPNEITEKWKNSTNKTVVTKKKTIDSVAFRISDITHLSAKKMAEGIRGHWGAARAGY